MTSHTHALFIQRIGSYDAYVHTKFIVSVGRAECFFPSIPKLAMILKFF